MGTASTSRRAVAELRAGDALPARSKIGSRSIHQYWSLLAPHFRGVLLAPQRRPDRGGVSWTWHEAAETTPLTAAELADVRRRLEGAAQSFAAKQAEPPEAAEPGKGDATAALAAQTRSGVQALVAALTGAPDSALAGFVCRTESGPMVHSWGAAAPVRPYFPDTFECEIGGAVLMGGESAAGINLVIENRQGTILARAQADATGAFRFQKIGAGNYRIRVIDRGDFPATGYAVSVEHESIAGLELRRGAAVATFANAGSPAAAGPEPEAGAAIGESAAPAGAAGMRAPSRWGRRRLLLGVTVLVVLVVVGWWQRARLPADVVRRGEAALSWWQSAGAPADAVPSADTPAGSPDGRRSVAVASSFAELQGKSVARGAAVAPAGRPAGSMSPRAGLTPGANGQKNSNLSRRPGFLDRPAAEADRTGEPDESERRPAPLQPPAGQSAAPRPPAAALKPPRQGAAGGHSPAADATTESASSGAGEGGVGTTAAPTPAAGGKSGRRAATAKRGAGAGSGNSAARTEPVVRGTITDTPAGAADGDRPEGAGPAAPTAGTSPPMRVVAANRAGAAGRPTAAAVAPAGAEGESDVAEPIAEEKSPPPRRSSGRQAGAGSAGPPWPPPESVAGEGAVPHDSATVAKFTLPEVAAAAAEGGNDSVAAQRAEARAGHPPAASAGGMDEGAAAPSLETGKRAVAAKARRVKRPPVSAGGPLATEGSAEPGAVPAPFRSTGGRPASGAPWQPWRVDVSAWEPRLLQDTVLPTHPVPAGADDALAAAREDMRREILARRPGEFLHPVTTWGLALEFSNEDPAPQHAPRWRDAAGGEPAGTSVRGNRAEVSWPGAIPSRPREVGLFLPDGRELACASVDVGGKTELTAAAAVRSWLWVEVELGRTDDGAPAGMERGVRLHWRLLSGAPVPAQWRTGGQGRSGRGYRLELPFPADASDPTSVALALVDPMSGWALVCEIGRR